MLEINQERQSLLGALVGLRYPAVTLKMIREGEALPEGAEQPTKDWGKHISLCQAFAFARRQDKVLYMEKDDHWCWNPIITYGMIDNQTAKAGFHALAKVYGGDAASRDAYVDSFPTLPFGEYKGMLIAPLSKMELQPDVTMIYCKNDQLRVLLMAIETQTHKMLDSSFNSVDSCTYAAIPSMQSGDYRITIPDPGEYERALTPEDDIILTVPKQREEEFFAGVAQQLKMGRGRNSFYKMMKEDFARPTMYNILYEAWGMGTSEIWDKEKKQGS